jgi:ribosomal protein S18 acetylase RimI-like enzyme
MTIIIREAQEADAEQLLAHVQRLLHEPERTSPLAPNEYTLTVEQERQVLTDFARTLNALFLVAEINGMLVGELNCKGGSRQALRHAVTLGMSVHQEWRNCGIGSRLLAEAITWAEQSSIVNRIELFVYAHNQAAIHLYEKFGFEVEGRRRRAIYQDGIYLDDLIMARLL